MLPKVRSFLCMCRHADSIFGKWRRCSCFSTLWQHSAYLPWHCDALHLIIGMLCFLHHHTWFLMGHLKGFLSSSPFHNPSLSPQCPPASNDKFKKKNAVAFMFLIHAAYFYILQKLQDSYCESTEERWLEFCRRKTQDKMKNMCKWPATISKSADIQTA